MTTQAKHRPKHLGPPYLVDPTVYEVAKFFVECEVADECSNVHVDSTEYHIWELAKRIQDTIEDYDYTETDP